MTDQATAPRGRDILHLQPHDSKTQLENLKRSPDPKGHERQRKMSQSQTKRGIARKRHITLTATRQQNTTRGPERLT